jgi:hypothetical protein
MATKKGAPKKASKKSPPASPASAKASVKKRSLNATGTGKPPAGDPFNNQDAKRRLGNFTTAGEHARVGGRTTGIVGQTKQRTRTDKRKSK